MLSRRKCCDERHGELRELDQAAVAEAPRLGRLSGDQVNTHEPDATKRDMTAMTDDRLPAAFGGSPPHEGENKVNLPLVRGRRERSERGGRSQIILDCGYILSPHY